MSSLVQEIAREAQQGVLDSIPAKWKLSAQLKTESNVMDIPKSCCILTPEQIAITEQTATEILGQLAAGSLSSVEVTEAFLARAAIAHQLTNCLTAFFPDEALDAARNLDAHLKSTGKVVGPLHGLPVSIKDMYNMTGHLVTLGYVSWAKVIADKDSTLVKALRNAGAVFYVKTTMPQTGMALETWSTLWGRTLNPRNNKLGSGGSSGGEGALIALKGSPIGPMSDIGGSIRAPAAFNGLYSIRPSSERIPKGGMQSTAPGQLSIKVSCGPACHSMADLKMFTKVINGHPLAEYDGSFIPIPWREVQKPTKLTIGILEFDGVCMPHPPILRAIRETAAKLKAAGHEGITSPTTIGT
ncbi:Acetamidase [Lachnellula subtilissima]|uniref:Acetamidase n=1 Tax=Lachnellula subtilissima TaxID=602034 RepID=A0A8H8RHB1_9HELO|nr:Acetamidase [Lachnellula subtilissima]